MWARAGCCRLKTPATVATGNDAAGIAVRPPPTVQSVSPASGPMSGGTPITITGSGFVSGATVEIGQGSGASASAIPATNVTVVSPTEITATTGAAVKGGSWNVFVLDSGGTTFANPHDMFTYTRPKVTGLNPATGPVTGGTSVTITGSGFIQGASTVEIGQGSGASASAIPATNVNVISPTEITATTGGGAKPGKFNLYRTRLRRSQRPPQRRHLHIHPRQPSHAIRPSPVTPTTALVRRQTPLGST